MSSTKKEETLRSGISALFGDGLIPRAQREEYAPEAGEEERTELINSVEDTELREALRARQLDGRGRPKKAGRKKDSRSAGYSTICVKANTEKWEKVREISLRETLQIKEVVEIAFDMLIEKYESEAGSIDLNGKPKKVFNK